MQSRMCKGRSVTRCPEPSYVNSE